MKIFSAAFSRLFNFQTRIAVTVCSSVLILMLSVQVQARTIADTEFPDVLDATGEFPQMTLNGASVRKYYYVVDMYVGLLYMQNPGYSEQAVIGDEGYKRMVFHTLLPRASGRRVAKALYDALNLSNEEAEALGAPIDEVIEMFDVSMKSGDETHVEYVPGVGTRIIVKNEVRGVIASKRLFDAFLGIWIGAKPFSETFKAEILGTENALIAHE